MLLNKDLKDYVEVSCDRIYHCDEYCCGDNICRCSTISYPEVEEVYINLIVNFIYDQYFDNSLETKRDNKIDSILFGTGKEINVYTIDRVVRHFKIWDKSLWEINIENGYYGEEVGEIFLDKNVAELIDSHVKDALNIGDLNKRIEYLLILEYGHLLPKLENRQYEVVYIRKEDISFKNESHFSKIKKEDLVHYSSGNYPNLIRGIVVSVGDKYGVIDGYHRCYATDSVMIKVIKVI